jgi:hypothetical protein
LAMVLTVAMVVVRKPTHEHNIAKIIIKVCCVSERWGVHTN